MWLPLQTLTGGILNIETVKYLFTARASDSVWNFTMAMVKAGLKDPSGNSLFSPVSILTTINMLLLGTKGGTKDEIMQALGIKYQYFLKLLFHDRVPSLHRTSARTISDHNQLHEQ